MKDSHSSHSATPIRVLFYQFFPGGGIGRYTHELASAVDLDSGVDVEVGCSPDYEHLSVASYRTWAGLQSIAHTVPLLRRIRFLSAQVANPIRCLNRAKATRADVIHYSNINHLTYRFWRARLKGLPCKYVATVHDVRRAGKILNRGWEERSLRQFYEDADGLFVHSEQQVSDLQSFADVPKSKIHLVPHGTYAYPEPAESVEKIRMRMGLPAKRSIGLYFGMVRDDKNLEGLLTGLARMTGPLPFLVVAGRMAEQGAQSEGHFRQRIHELGLDEDVLLINRFIATEDVGDFYRVADFSCLTYKKYFTSQSGVLNVAMHFRCPVLVTPAPTLAETLDHFDIGVRCEDDTPRAIESGIQEMQSRLDGGRPFDFEAYRQAHSWDENARRTIQVYRRLVESD
jgi:glycosyltransferase involved in cell wall biosynthesis